jgi:citrate synthase
MLRDRVLELIPEVQAQNEEIRAAGDKVVAEVTLGTVLGGLPQTKVLFSALPGGKSRVDPNQGLLIAGRPIKEICDEPFEANLWRLITGEEPTSAQVQSLRSRLGEGRQRFSTGLGGFRAEDLAEAHTSGNETDFMLALAGIVAGLSTESRLYKYFAANQRTDNLEVLEILEDTLDLIGALSYLYPMLVQKATGRKGEIALRGGQWVSHSVIDGMQHYHNDVQREAQLRGMNQMLNLMCYHGTGNVSTFSATVAYSGSGGIGVFPAYLSLLGGLWGCNHGGAAPVGLRFLLDAIELEGVDASSEALLALAKSRLEQKLPIWCCGHRLLRVSDPRAEILQAELEAQFAHDPRYQFAKRWYEAACSVLREQGNAKFPEPNVDAYSGLYQLLLGIIPDSKLYQLAGLTFALSRAAALVELFWSSLPKKGLIGPKVALLRPSVLTRETVKSL